MIIVLLSLIENVGLLILNDKLALFLRRKYAINEMEVISSNTNIFPDHSL